MRIKKTSQYMQGGASLSNVYGTSNENGYTQEYINKQNEYSTDEIDTGKKWIDDKPIYRKCFAFNKSSAGDALILIIDNLDVIVNANTYIKRSDSSGQYKNINNFFSTTTDMFNVYVSFNQIRCSSPYMGTIYGVLEYTKTTD